MRNRTLTLSCLALVGLAILTGCARQDETSAPGVEPSVSAPNSDDVARESDDASGGMPVGGTSWTLLLVGLGVGVIAGFVLAQARKTPPATAPASPATAPASDSHLPPPVENMGLQQLVEAIVEIARGAPESDVVRVASIAEGVGLIRIQPVPGTPFDPQAHRVVDTVTDHGSNHSPSTIVRVVRDGWALAGDVVQPADVVVNS